ncbi:MAG: response regulator transcription factor [Desulfobacteraceae bacterium]|nr:response regulator transcription factor [Desulfobacteraceae bacterium]
MMIFLLSKDYFFIKACLKIFKNKQTKQLNTAKFDKAKSIAGTDDIIILDVSNIVIEELSKIQCAAVALSNTPKYDEAMQLLNYGFRGYGNKYMLPENLNQAVQTVMTGQVWLPPTILSTMIARIPQNEKENKSVNDFKLSKRELEVVKLVAKGLSNKEISEKMNITIRTAKSHLTSIFNKTGFRDRLELAINFK